MGLGKGILLGFIQGLTEFLPVSSSGHLVLAQHFLGVAPGLFFDIMVHVGTLLAVFAVFWADVVALTRALGRGLRALFQGRLGWALRMDADVRLLAMLLLGTIPAGVAGITLKDLFARLFNAPAVAAVMLLLTGVLLWSAERRARPRKDLGKIGAGEALVIGIGQALAILPGLSRSGTTIATALFTGVQRGAAARFSFLLSIPAILGAAVLEGKDVWQAGEAVLRGDLLLAMLAAALSGYVAIKLVFRALEEKKFRWFAYYCWILGTMALLALALGF